VAGFHGEAAAASADENWARMFQQKETAEDLEAVSVAFESIAGPQPVAHFGVPVDATKPVSSSEISGFQLRLPKLLVALGLASSGAEANRKIAEKAVKLDGETVESSLVFLSSLPAQVVVRLGKRAKIAVIA
jgi:tyrosyl-tRNA synthetase